MLDRFGQDAHIQNTLLVGEVKQCLCVPHLVVDVWCGARICACFGTHFQRDRGVVLKKGQLCWRHMMRSDSPLHAAAAQGGEKEAQQPKQATPPP